MCVLENGAKPRFALDACAVGATFAREPSPFTEERDGRRLALRPARAGEPELFTQEPGEYGGVYSHLR